MDPALQKSLETIGIGPGNYRALMLLPLVYVAWADGKMEKVEVARIDDIAKNRLFLGEEAIRLLDGWLAKPPDKIVFLRGLEDLFLLAQTEEGEPLVHPEELHDLLLHAESIARATASAIDSPTAVTPEEEVALEEIARVLKIDNGVSWARLLDDLDAGPTSLRAGRAPRSSQGAA